jgi:hypothetical protein
MDEKDFVAGEGMDLRSLVMADICDALGEKFYCLHSITQEEYDRGLEAIGYLDSLLQK